MTIQENLAAVGSWEIDLLATIPREALDALQFFGHIAIIPGRVDPLAYGDSLLAPGVARYVGVLRSNSLADDARTNAPNDNIKISGVGMAFWLGDEDNKGDIIENVTTFASGSLFPDVVRALLPASGAVTEGTLYPVAGTYAGTHQWQTPAQATEYVCETMSTADTPVTWRVNNDATLDAGPHADLFVTTPQAAIVARGGGEDMALRGVPGSMNLDSDMKDYTTRLVLLAQGDGASTATGVADIDPGLNPYRDLHGNPLAMTRLVSESDTTAGNADTRAAISLQPYTTPNRSLQLSIQDYDVQGVFALGDYIWAYDPDKALVDTGQEILFRGQRLNPIMLQVVGIQWPVTADYTVAYRAADGTWIDLTNYIEINDAGTYVTVGDFSRQLTDASTEPVGTRPVQDTSIPGVPVLVEPFQGSAYLDAIGFTRARVLIGWDAPTNVDGSTVLDGDHYEIRYAIDTDTVYPATWSAVSQIRWEDMQTWAQPFAAPDSGWQVAYAGWSDTQVQLQDLSPGVGYDVQIRAVDTSGNASDWSATVTFVATSDNIPPSAPAPPEVAASRIALQITHRLGKATGGVFTLESDLDHLEVHASADELFTPGLGTLLGKLKANAGMIQGQIPAVGTYPVESTDALWVKVVAVDIAGNRSGPSTAVQSTALLIDDQHIDSLTVSKVTAGTITASWVMAGEIKTADTGPRARISADGYELFDAAGERTFFGEAATGNLSLVGQLSSAASGRRIVVNPSFDPEIRFYADSGPDYSFINAFTFNTLTGIGFNSAQYSQPLSGDDVDVLTNRIIIYPMSSGVVMQVIDADTEAVKGGYFQATSVGAEFGYQYSGSSAQPNAYYADTNGIRAFGNTINSSAVFAGGNEAWVVGGGNILSGATADNHVFSATLLFGTPNILLTVSHPSLRTLQCTARSSSGFTATISSSVSGTAGYTFWVFQT